jgi:hypothetical protein
MEFGMTAATRRDSHAVGGLSRKAALTSGGMDLIPSAAGHDTHRNKAD